MLTKVTRRDFLAATSGAVAQESAQPVRGFRGRPNILHIMSDQQQWGTIVNRSECRTPNLNRLASSGMVFDRSYTPTMSCCPVRAMLLSGAYHWHNGVFNQVHVAEAVRHDVYPDTIFYSQRLREAGYRLGYVGKWHASYTRSPLDFGYHEFANPDKALVDPRVMAKLDLNPDRVELPKGRLKQTGLKTIQWPGSKPSVMWGYSEGPEEATSAYLRAEMAIRMMKRFAKGGQPWHLEAHFSEPHDSYMPLKKYLDRYDPRSIQVSENFHDSFEGKPGMHRKEAAIWGPLSEDDFRQARACYYAYTEQLDQQIGRILQALDRTGQADNTIVVFTTDHGDMVGAHHMFTKHWFPYEECYRVPLIIRVPGVIRPGTVCTKLVQTHDLAHTYVQLAGARPLPYADGRSLAPLIEDPSRADWHDQILCAFYGQEFLHTQRMAITERFKYVFNGIQDDEFYDLDADPGELRNAVVDHRYQAQVDDMRARLHELMAQYEDPYGDVAPRNALAPLAGKYGAARYLPRGKRLP